MKNSSILACLSCLLLVCSHAFGQETINKAVAVIHPTKGYKANGIVTFTTVEGGVRIVAEITGLKPGEHGFHIHEFGDCSALDGTSAGGHFNPTNKRHGCPSGSEHHVGDLGNIIADASGRAKYDAVNNVIKLKGPNSIIGRAVIVHAGQDDCVTQPTGDSGARVGCGVIGVGKQSKE